MVNAVPQPDKSVADLPLLSRAVEITFRELIVTIVYMSIYEVDI